MLSPLPLPQMKATGFKLPMPLWQALTTEAAQRTASSGKHVSASAIVREALSTHLAPKVVQLVAPPGGVS